jgi:hypothetical protein
VCLAPWLARGSPTTPDLLSAAAAGACQRLIFHLCFLVLQELARLLALGAKAHGISELGWIEVLTYYVEFVGFLNRPLGPSRTYDSWLLLNVWAGPREIIHGSADGFSREFFEHPGSGFLFTGGSLIFLLRVFLPSRIRTADEILGRSDPRFNIEKKQVILLPCRPE